MANKNPHPITVNSISELHRLWCLPKPVHPLISVINLGEISSIVDVSIKCCIYNFYSVIIKKDCYAKLKYGQNYYDFDEGVMIFLAPGQVISTKMEDDMEIAGRWLVIHPDLIRPYPLSKKIKEYGYFSYATKEALHLSEKEESMIEVMFANIDNEYRSAIDTFSQNVIVSHVDLLLNYCDRFYNRQFITRKAANNDLLQKLDELLTGYLESDQVQKSGLPTVQYISSQLNVSPSYLSDMLRTQTGQSTQQHIHYKLIEKAREILTTTTLSVGEIAHLLGFEHPQSFNKLFKSKTQVSPLVFRNSFN